MNISQRIAAIEKSHDEHARALKQLLGILQGDATDAIQGLYRTQLETYAGSMHTILRMLNNIGDHSNKLIVQQSEKLDQMGGHLQSVTSHLADVKSRCGTQEILDNLAISNPDVFAALKGFLASIQALCVSSHNALAHFV